VILRPSDCFCDVYGAVGFREETGWTTDFESGEGRQIDVFADFKGNGWHGFEGIAGWAWICVPVSNPGGDEYNQIREAIPSLKETYMYPELMVIPMREELTRVGVAEARSSADVDAAVAQPGTTMLVVNSICGCAAGKMRPGVRLALQNATKPDHAVTVFAGQDREATERARSYFQGHPPTSPAIAILRDGQLVYLMQRSAIESSTAPAIAQELQRAFDTYCTKTTA
jgi:putative YphP/YqiW family bacilliredoxin